MILRDLEKKERFILAGTCWFEEKVIIFKKTDEEIEKGFIPVATLTGKKIRFSEQTIVIPFN